MGELDNTVAVITGAARGQGRSHAVALAKQGADIIAVDICADIDAIPYPLGTKSDLDKTAQLVRDAGRKVVPVVADVRDLAALEAGVQAGIDDLGDIDIVIANAGVVAIGDPETRAEPVVRRPSQRLAPLCRRESRCHPKHDSSRPPAQSMTEFKFAMP